MLPLQATHAKPGSAKNIKKNKKGPASGIPCPLIGTPSHRVDVGLLVEMRGYLRRRQQPSGFGMGES